MISWLGTSALITGWDMEKFSAGVYVEIGSLLGKFAAVGIPEDGPIPVRSKMVTDWLPAIEYRCREIGLRQAAKHAARIAAELAKGKTLLSVFKDRMAPELKQRITDEMEDQLFFHVPVSRAEYFGKPELFGREVANNFSSATVNIEEAGNCYALGRYTAAVFHLQGVMQIGLETLGNAIGVSVQQNRTWDAILNKIDPELTKRYTDKSPYFQKNETFCGETTALLRSVKIAWRNPTMHVEKPYDEDKALEILNAVKGFMRHLATSLSEQIPGVLTPNHNANTEN
jgi:hypothetical protein